MLLVTVAVVVLQASWPDPPMPFKQALTSWARCTAAEADALAPRSAERAEIIADAALGRCVPEQMALEDQFAFLAERARDPRQIARAEMVDMRATQREQLIARVIRARMEQANRRRHAGRRAAG